MINACRIIKSESKLIIIEIDTENNRELIDDLSKKISRKRLTKEEQRKKLVAVTFWGIYLQHLKLISYKICILILKE